MPDYPPLTPEEQAQLAQLTYQQELAEWQVREAARIAELAKFEPLDGVVDLGAVIIALDAVDMAVTDIDTRNRISRIRTILTLDLGALLSRLDQLGTPEAEPVAP